MATQSKTTFQQACEVRCEIAAPVEKVWAVLTQAGQTWNSTVTKLEGVIALGERLAIQVPIAPKRTFRPKVTRLVPSEAMEWRDGFAPMFRGVRTFTLTARGPGRTEFAMSEVFSGLMLPLIRKSLPDFGPAFDTYASDLKRAAEA